ncbi:helix-turn-helix domain-containing protein [Nocardioides daejeonensis]|uniref:helix-turn-helix domain-containing protein n=1 Tax=Nocardioides daejeonensis TaxID=1046556 RepID=UPI001EF41E56|nr:helix-turn-helix transcriptional regulator [Nocardioides daejeonensis]
MSSTRNPAWDDYAAALGNRLSRARQRLGLSQERVAHAAGISGYTYQKFEKGESKPGTPMNPRLITLVALSQVLEVDLSELLGDFPDMTQGR